MEQVAWLRGSCPLVALNPSDLLDGPSCPRSPVPSKLLRQPRLLGRSEPALQGGLAPESNHSLQHLQLLENEALTTGGFPLFQTHLLGIYPLLVQSQQVNPMSNSFPAQQSPSGGYNRPQETLLESSFKNILFIPFPLWKI